MLELGLHRILPTEQGILQWKLITLLNASKRFMSTYKVYDLCCIVSLTFSVFLQL
jgi:hypothetical protein